MLLPSFILRSLAALTSSTQVLLITPTIIEQQISSCSPDFLGTYGTRSNQYYVYRSSTECANILHDADRLDNVHIAPIHDNVNSYVVYLQQASVEPWVHGMHGSFDNELGLFLRRIRTASMNIPNSSPQSLLPATGEAVVLYATSDSALVLVPGSLLGTLNTFLPPLFVPIVLHNGPQSLLPVPSDAVKRVSAVLASLRFSPDVAAIVNQLSVLQMQNDIRFLTGEDDVSGIVSRHSFTSGARVAARWIKAQIESTGATCELRPFLVGFAPNVVCRYPSTVNTTATVLLSAHYDSRGTFGSTRAPGANDDGSGVLSLLGIARVIQGRRLKFRSNVELVAFAGEEQGLLGSRAYAKELRDNNANLTLMIQADMLAYHRPNEPPQLGLPDLIGTPEVTQLVANVSSIYSPELAVGFTPACCSDHQTFHEQGFPATQVFERAGPIADPKYHDSGDLSDREGYDLEQVKSIAKVTFATLLHTAGFDPL